METKYEVIPLFSTPLYGNNVPDQLVLDHISLLDNEKILKEKDGIPVKDYGSRSQNTYILNQPQYQNLHNYILQHATYYAENYLNYNYEHYKFSQSWISIKQPNQKHSPHSHANSLVSGVLFYGDFNDKTSHISFIRDDFYSKSVGGNKMGLNLNQFSYINYDLLYRSNLLVLFPSYLVHSVSKNLTNIPRKSLAFNTIPRDGFGREGSLTELKFN
jgi:uncharacterized protein (TIGR02466 family)